MQHAWCHVPSPPLVNLSLAPTPYNPVALRPTPFRHNLPSPTPPPTTPRAQLVKEVINPKAQLVYQENTADDPSRRRPDISRMVAKYGWEPKVPLREGLLRMVDDFRRRLHVQ